MKDQPDIHGRIEARVDYRRSDGECRDECDDLSEELDRLFEVAPGVGGYVTLESYGENIVRFERNFVYYEEESIGDMKSRIEKVLYISYEYIEGMLTMENYRVAVNTIIHCEDGLRYPIMNIYEIEYYGADRASVMANIEQPNLVDVGQPDYVSRAMTLYDNSVLFDELQPLLHLIDEVPE